ncbi:MAG: response regulator transcription factor [Micrococcus sp.]|nr:response regulator transcription factor [Micrococcus sp.]
MTPILLIEDEDRIVRFVTKGLKAEGFAVTAAGTGLEGLGLALTGAFDLVILDIGLPDIDGFEVLTRLRAHDTALPVIILTARSSAADTVEGLTSGADDYMPKPFRFAELVARIRLRLRSAGVATGPVAEVDPVLRHADLELDPVAHTVKVGGRTVELSAREFALAEEFLRHPGQALTREQLLNSVWGYDFDPGSNVVDVYVRYLRAKIGAARIVTVRGVGYRLVHAEDYAGA